MLAVKLSLTFGKLSLIHISVMAGQEGGYRTTNKNLTVIKVDVENNYLLIKGNVPGPKRGLVMVRSAKTSKGNSEPVTLVDYTKEEE